MLWYGDWLRAKQTQPEENAAALAKQLGFAKQEKTVRTKEPANLGMGWFKKPAELVLEPEQNIPEIQQAGQTDGQEIDYMLRAVHYEHQAKDEDEKPAERPKFLEGLSLQSHEALLQRGQEGPPPSPTQLIMPWRRLGPILRQRLRRPRNLRRLDMAKTIRLVASGRTVRKLPRQTKQTWPRVLHLWRDVSLKMTGMQYDYADIQRHLEQWLGHSRLDISLMKNGPKAKVYRQHDGALPSPQTGEAVLILGDLNADSGIWKQLGEQFQQNAINAQTLHPAGSSKPPRGIQTVAWGNRANAQNKALSTAIEKLLIYTSAALFTEPALLRAIRILDKQIPLAAEMAIWHQPEIEPTWEGVFHKPETIRYSDYQKQFTALPPEQKQAIASLIIQHHAHWHIEPRAEELRQLKLLGVELSEQDDELQSHFFQQLALQMEQGKAPPDTAEWLRQIYQRQGLAQLENTDEAYAFALLQAEKEKILADPSAWPWGIPLRYRDWIQAEVVQCKRTLYKTPNGLVLSTENLADSSPIITVVDTGWLALKQGGLEQKIALSVFGENFLLPLKPPVKNELENSGFSITTSEMQIEFAYEEKPEWSERMGHDQYGLYAEVKIASEGFKMRWIPPGEFMMGSPKDEPGKFEWEVPQHHVQFKQGYWLAETACSQALQEAVTGENLSRFNDNPQNPVENIEWEMAQVFIRQINQQKSGLDLRLPSEAEWEYACRAGTTTPFWWGNALNTDQANYNGNYPYNDGEKGEYRRKTLPVNAFQANPWGLYQMHGNVWEWCQDKWHDNYQSAPADGQAWETGDSQYRVCRGGSWFFNGRHLRSACRFDGWHDFGFVGLRLARGPDEHSA